eukprot:50098_1
MSVNISNVTDLCCNQSYLSPMISRIESLNTKNGARKRDVYNTKDGARKRDVYRAKRAARKRDVYRAKRAYPKGDTKHNPSNAQLHNIRRTDHRFPPLKYREKRKNFNDYSIHIYSNPCTHSIITELLIESAQSLLGHMDPFVERIIIEAQNWCNRNNKVYGNHPQKTLESSLKNGLDLSSIDALTLRDKMPLLRGKLLENDTKYQSLFGEPLHTNLDELLHEMNTRTIDHKYIAKLHTIFNSKFKLTQLYLFLILKCDFTRISLASKK